jgi:hypothetical protein
MARGMAYATYALQMTSTIERQSMLATFVILLLVGKRATPERDY